MQLPDAHTSSAYCLRVWPFTSVDSVKAIVDSGAEVNLIGDHWLPAGTKLQRSTVNIKGLTGHNLRMRGFCEAKLAMQDGNAISMKAAVVPQSKIVLLGMPFLKSLRATIHFDEKVIRFQGRMYEVEDRIGQLEVNSAFNSRRTLEDIMSSHKAVWEGERIGTTNVVEHEIHLEHKRPICCRPRHCSLQRQEILDAEVERMLEKGVIRHSTSPYASGAVLARKKTGEWRFCADYRPLNEITVKDEHPLPRIKDLIESVRESKYFIALDLRAGYWQIKMREEHIPYTAFRTHRGLYEFTVMPFGLVNAPATFQRLMDTLFGDLRWRGVLVYLDDLLLHGRTKEETLMLLDIVLSRLESAGLTLRLDKCEFFPERLRYLGHTIGQDGIQPDRERVEGLEKLEAPKDIKGVRRILGLFGYYRDYIPNFASITEPLVQCLRGNKNFTWSDEHDLALQELKERLMNKVLSIPIQGDTFILEVDASDNAVGAILSVERDERRLPIEFASKVLSTAERKWPAREKEAYAIIWGLRHFDRYLRGRSVKVYTDHKSLKWFMDAQKGKLARWAQTIQEYDIEIHYQKGSENEHVDALSRNPEHQDPVEERMVYILEEGTRSLPSLEEVTAEQMRESTQLPQDSRLTKIDGIFRHQHKIYVPKGLRSRVLDFFHTSIERGHPGVTRTSKKIQQLFSWPGMMEDIRRYIRGCLTCQRINSGKERLQGEWRIHPNVLPFESVHMDFWGPIRDHNGADRYILSMIDYGTRWAEAILMETKHAKAIAEEFMKNWCCRYGIPSKIVTDQDKSFMDKSLQELLMKLGCRPLHSTVYHPEGNAPVETFHRNLRKGLASLRSTCSSLSLDEEVQMVMFAYRTGINTATANTPSYMLFGMDICLPAEREWWRSTTRGNGDRLRILSNVRFEVLRKANATADRRIERLNMKRQQRIFKVGDLILIRLTDKQRRKLIRHEENRKLYPLWSIPYRVLQVKSEGKAAICKSLLTKEIRECHLQNARFLEKPQSPAQKRLWEGELELEPFFTNEDTRNRLLQEFWENIDETDEMFVDIPHERSDSSDDAMSD